MPDYDKHLYMIVFPTNALVASQLNPEQFAEYYTIGSSKHYEGKVIFCELDPKFRDPYFQIDDYLKQTVPHPNGAPKKTKFISSYAVLEHVPLKAIQAVYLVTTEGKALKLEEKPYDAVNEPGLVRLYQEITPVTNLVASTLDQRAFGKYITSETRSKGAPKVVFTQFELDIPDFMRRHEGNDVTYCPIPDTNPSRLHEYLVELKASPEKKTKTIGLNSALWSASYRLLRHGIWFAAPGEVRFFPIPSVKQLEHDHYEWWRSANN